MTIKYECDRCHAQFEKKSDVFEITAESQMGSYGVYTVTLHYCKKCSIYFNNAISIVNDGSYDGRLKG